MLIAPPPPNYSPLVFLNEKDKQNKVWGTYNGKEWGRLMEDLKLKCRNVKLMIL